jgi:hypothetical protein
MNSISEGIFCQTTSPHGAKKQRYYLRPVPIAWPVLEINTASGLIHSLFIIHPQLIKIECGKSTR